MGKNRTFNEVRIMNIKTGLLAGTAILLLGGLIGAPRSSLALPGVGGESYSCDLAGIYTGERIIDAEISNLYRPDPEGASFQVSGGAILVDRDQILDDMSEEEKLPRREFHTFSELRLPVNHDERCGKYVAHKGAMEAGIGKTTSDYTCTVPDFVRIDFNGDGKQNELFVTTTCTYTSTGLGFGGVDQNTDSFERY